MKKIISLLLASVMIFALCVPAMAGIKVDCFSRLDDIIVSGEGTIPNGALSNMYAYQTVFIEEGITGIEQYACQYCGYKRIVLPSTFRSIGMRAFYECYNLSEIEIPDSVTSIDYHAFHECPKLTVTLHRTKDTWISPEAFDVIKKLIVMVPYGWDGDHNSFGASECEYVTDTATIKDGYYIIRSAVDPNYCLDVAGGAKAKSEGDNVRLWPASTSTAKIFRIAKDGKGYKIEAAHSGMVLDIAGYDTSNDGVNIYQWTDYGTDNQRWTFEKANAKNSYYIHTVKSGNAGWMDAEGCVGGATPDSEGKTNVYSWSYTGNPNQMWILEKVDYKPSGFTVSEGNVWIIGIGAAAIFGIGGYFIKKKKDKKPEVTEE